MPPPRAFSNRSRPSGRIRTARRRRIEATLRYVIDPVSVATIVGCGVAILAAWYAAGPYVAQKRDQRRDVFVETRQRISQDRHRLTEKALGLYSERFTDPRLPGVLSSRDLIPDVPFRLSQLSVEVATRQPMSSVTQTRAYRQLLPRLRSGRPIERYSDAIAEYCPPSLWFNGLSFALQAVTLHDTAPSIQVGTLRYFEGIDTSEALAHELALKPNGKSMDDFPLRGEIRNPLDFSRFRSLAAVSALTLRLKDGGATFYLHERDPTKVAMAGGHFHLTPSGVYQPTSSDPITVIRDSSPILTLCREYAEEYLGVEEARGSAGASLSYTEDEPYKSILQALHLEEGTGCGCWMMGIGVDPLTLAPEIICVVAIDHERFDSLFVDMLMQDSEGWFRGAKMRAGRLVGYDFTRSSIEHLSDSGRLSPVAAAALEIAWASRDLFLAD